MKKKGAVYSLYGRQIKSMDTSLGLVTDCHRGQNVRSRSMVAGLSATGAGMRVSAAAWSPTMVARVLSLLRGFGLPTTARAWAGAGTAVAALPRLEVLLDPALTTTSPAVGATPWLSDA